MDLTAFKGTINNIYIYLNQREYVKIYQFLSDCVKNNVFLSSKSLFLPFDMSSSCVLFWRTPCTFIFFGRIAMGQSAQYNYHPIPPVGTLHRYVLNSMFLCVRLTRWIFDRLNLRAIVIPTVNFL